MRTQVSRAIKAAGLSALLALNNDHAAALSWQEPAAPFATLLEQACWTRTVGDAQALLIALDQDARYENPNFAWLAARFARFVCIDRVVVTQELQARE